MTHGLSADKRDIYTIATKKDGKRLITISCIAGLDMECDVCGCEEEASYMGGGRTCCTFHWIRGDGEEERNVYIK
jgi:hypothetical protein